MLKGFKKLVSLVLVLAVSMVVSVPAFAEDPKDSVRNSDVLINQAQEQQAESYAVNFIKKERRTSEANSIQWNSSTSIAEKIPLYDFEGNINSYLFRLTTNGSNQGFILVDLTADKPYAEAYCATGKLPADYMMLKHSDHEITAEDKIIHAGMFKYAFEKNDVFYDLESNQPIGIAQNDLQESYTRNTQLANSKSTFRSNNSVIIRFHGPYLLIA